MGGSEERGWSVREEDEAEEEVKRRQKRWVLGRRKRRSRRKRMERTEGKRGNSLEKGEKG